MAQTVCVVLDAVEGEQFDGDRGRPQPAAKACRACGHRARLADRGSAKRAQSIGVGRPTVWRWQQRSAEAAKRGSRERLKVRRRCGCSWRARKMRCTELGEMPVALAIARPVQCVAWCRGSVHVSATTRAVVAAASGALPGLRLLPHNNPATPAKLADIVGLYVDPPALAVVLSLYEKSQIQALDRTQPGLPLKPGQLPDRDALQAARHHHGCSPRSACSTHGDRSVHATPPPQ